MVVWLLGVSGSGKTTLAERLKRDFDRKNIKSFIVDGDLIRDFFDRDLGYSKKERVENIKRVMITAFVLEQNGIVPIVANISPYQELRDLAREKFDEYIEIYLKRDIETISNKDEVYQGSNVIGVDLKFDIPTNPNLVLDTGSEDIDISFKRILDFLEKRINGR
jgi:adenylylsulfate kinase